MQSKTATKNHYIPIYRCQLVREGSQKSDTRYTHTPEEVYAIAQEYFEGADREHFVVLLLNTKNKVLGINTVSIGTLNASLVHPREIFKPAILINAAAIILVHNHPSGDPTPSSEDMEITQRLCKAGEILGIEVLDHLIISDDGMFTSFRERGLV